MKQIPVIPFALTCDEFLTELDAERSEARLFGLLLLDTGMRLGKALALRWEDVWPGKDGDDTGSGPDQRSFHDHLPEMNAA